MNSWVKKFSELVPVIVVGFYSLNMDTIMAGRRWSPFSYQLFLFFGLVLIYSVFSAVSRKVLSTDLPRQPLVKWLLFLVLASLTSTLISQGSGNVAQAWIYTGTTALIVLTTVHAMLFVRRNNVQNERPYLYIILFVILSIAIIVDPIVDFRSVLNIDTTGNYEITRGGGLYFQPNVAGTAIAFLYGVVVPRVTKRAASGLTLLAASAVFFTFSRSGMIVLLILVASAMSSDYLKKSSVVLWSAVFIGLVLYLGGLEFITGVFNIDSGSGYNRLHDAGNFIGVDALIQDSRVAAAYAAFDSYLIHPFLGYGIGYSWYWAEAVNGGVGTHNLILRNMLEYGVIGTLIWVLFLVSLYRSRPPEGISARWAFGVCLAGFVTTFFSHNITEQGIILVPLIAAVMLVVPKRQVQ